MSEYRFTDKVRAGDIIHVTQLRNGLPDRRWWGGCAALIQFWLGDGCHDGIWVIAPDCTGIGDTIPHRARITPKEDYERRMSNGEITVQVFRPKGAMEYDGDCAGNYWRTHQLGEIYNYPAYLLLPFKVFSDKLQWHIDLPWEWCTEAVMWSWKEGADMDVYHNRKPTPWTTIKRYHDGELVYVKDAIERLAVPA